MGERKGTKGLELWCRRMTEGYPGVNVVNMTTSWRDGLAFCAIIHHFRPDLIDFSKLNKDDIYHNNELAFRVAERHLGIPALLEPEDMVEFPVPDRLSILTYLSQFYQAFVVGQGKSPTRIATKRPATASPDHTLVPSAPSTSPPSKAGKLRREPCAKCGLPVFIAERLNVGKLLYHRTCFRCARCDSQLTLANYYETETGEFCCETCPDEEKSTFPDASVLTRSLSDEEKSASLKQNDENDITVFETALEFPKEASKTSSTLGSSQYSKARSFFVNSQVDDSGNEEEPPDLPETGPPPRSDFSFSDSGFPNNRRETYVVHTVSGSLGKLEESHDIVTKDEISAEGNTSSLVKARMRLFENKSDAPNETHSADICKVPLESLTSSNLEVERENKEEESCDKLKNTTPEESVQEESKKDEETLKNDATASDLKEESIIKISESDRTSSSTISSIKQETSTSIIEISSEIPSIDSEKEETSETSIMEISSEIPENEETPSVIEIMDESIKQNQNEDTSPVIEHYNAKPEKSEYPDDLNPFDDEPEQNDPLNPFDDDNDETEPNPVPAARKKIKPTAEDKEMSRIYIERVSINPFEEEDEEEVKIAPQPASRRVIAALRISLNPFWSDDEENEEKPTPKPRVSKSSMDAIPRDDASQTRKKKLAPRPPGVESSGPSSLTSSPSHSVTHSPRFTPKIRKSKKAPPPPTSTPIEKTTSPPSITVEDVFEQEKFVKDEQNRNRQSQNFTSSDNMEDLAPPNKSTYGKWKRRKGQAPSRPIPQRRTIKSLPMVEVRRELEIIEIQQQGLEKQGVRLEQMIREKCEAPDVNPDDSLAPEIEDMVLQLFELVNEKNELFRKQAELMYLRRQHKLEEEHAEVEYQIRCLMLQPEANKTDSDKTREEELISRLVEIVERRNEIIECLEMDRVREAEEDDSINNQLNLYTLKKEEDKSLEKATKKTKSKHKKEKKFKFKGHKVDADKDIDESECPASTTKEKKKKKFAIF